MAIAGHPGAVLLDERVELEGAVFRVFFRANTAAISARLADGTPAPGLTTPVLNRGAEHACLFDLTRLRAGGTYRVLIDMPGVLPKAFGRWIAERERTFRSVMAGAAQASELCKIAAGSFPGPNGIVHAVAYADLRRAELRLRVSDRDDFDAFSGTSAEVVRRWTPDARPGRQGRALPQSVLLGRAAYETTGRKFIPYGVVGGRQDRVWFDPATWQHVPDFTGKRLALVGNAEVRGQGRAIDACDDVIRFNRMGLWRRSAEDDGERITIWAGNAARRYLAIERHIKLRPESQFPDIASRVRMIWSINPFHIETEFVEYLHAEGLMDKLFISGGAVYFLDTLIARLPPELVRSLYAMPDKVLPGGASNLRFNFELLLSGVQTALFCFLGGAREIALYGFAFYKGVEHENWGGHDLAFDESFLDALISFAATRGCQIRRIVS